MSPDTTAEKKIPIFPLQTIDFSRLVSKDSAEINKLIITCERDGFFYLNLKTSREGNSLLEDKAKMFEAMDDYFTRPHEAKMQDHTGTVYHGYKPAGTFSGGLDDTRDGWEGLKVSYDCMVRKNNLPSVVNEKLELFDRFIKAFHFVNQTMLSAVSDGLNLVDASRFEAHHPEGEKSYSMLLLMRYANDPSDAMRAGQNVHTDIGSFAVLFTSQWGLQVLSPTTKEWEYVEPKDDLAIVNVGDTLRFLSGKRFYSCVHRVIPVDYGHPKQSIAYFLRPANTVKFEDSIGQEATAGGWHDSKYTSYADSTENQAVSHIQDWWDVLRARYRPNSC